MVSLGLNRIDCLARDAELFGEVGLRPVPLAAQLAHAVFHSHLRMAIEHPAPLARSTGARPNSHQSAGSPAFCENVQVRVIRQVAKKLKAAASSWVGRRNSSKSAEISQARPYREGRRDDRAERDTASERCLHLASQHPKGRRGHRRVPPVEGRNSLQMAFAIVVHQTLQVKHV
jgi:hypothetical protein